MLDAGLHLPPSWPLRRGRKPLRLQSMAPVCACVCVCVSACMPACVCLHAVCMYVHVSGGDNSPVHTPSRFLPPQMPTQLAAPWHTPQLPLAPRCDPGFEAPRVLTTPAMSLQSHPVFLPKARAGDGTSVSFRFNVTWFADLGTRGGLDFGHKYRAHHRRPNLTKKQYHTGPSSTCKIILLV